MPLLDDLLNGDDRVDEGFGPRRTAGNIHVDRKKLIDPLNEGVGVEDTTARRTCSH